MASQSVRGSQPRGTRFHQIAALRLPANLTSRTKMCSRNSPAPKSTATMALLLGHTRCGLAPAHHRLLPSGGTLQLLEASF